MKRFLLRQGIKRPKWSIAKTVFRVPQSVTFFFAAQILFNYHKRFIIQMHAKVNAILQSTIKSNVLNHYLLNCPRWIVAAVKIWERLGEMVVIFVQIMIKVKQKKKQFFK